MSSTKILITGASGYIGGTALKHILAQPTPALKSAEISYLIRNEAHASLFPGAKAVVGNAEDLDSLRKLAANYDIIINNAFTFATDPAVALAQGLADRYKANPSGKVPHFFHTSGTSDLSDRPFTEKWDIPNEFTDLEPLKAYQTEQALEKLEAHPQRSTDLAVINVGVQSGIQVHILMSPTIYGQGTGPGNTFSIQIPLLIQTALKDGYASYIGDGREEWDHVHVSDLASLNSISVSRAINGDSLPANESGIIFTETGRHSWKQLAGLIAEAGVKVGALKGADVRSVTLEEAQKKYSMLPAGFVEVALASNARTQGEVAKGWGWRSEHGDAEWRESFVEEWKAVLEKRG